MSEQNCIAPNCTAPRKAQRLCSRHYEQARLAAQPPCSVAECKRRAEKTGLCGAHYFRKRIHGSPIGGRTPNKANLAFIEAALLVDTDSCIEWPYPRNTNGYGRIANIGYAHQIVCERAHGPAPSDAHEVAHRCGNRRRINRRYVRWATHKENVADTLLHGTHARHLRGKLTEDAVREIRRRIISEEGVKLAALFGVSQSLISAIKLGRAWADV